MANHLKYVVNPAYRNAISKIRCSSHLLNIERGRHTNPKTPIDERKCISCDCVEDEMHFIINCSLYTQERQRLFDGVIKVYPPFNNMNNIENLYFC